MKAWKAAIRKAPLFLLVGIAASAFYLLTEFLWDPILYPSVDQHIPGTLSVPHETFHRAMAVFLILAMAIGAELAGRRRNRREKLLAEQGQELAAIYDHIPLILVLVDRERKVRKVNRLASALAGLPAESLLGSRPGEVLRCLHALADPRGCGFGPDCERCNVRRTILKTLETGTPAHEVEARLSLTLDGKQAEVVMLLSTARLEIRDDPLVLVSLRDITRELELQEELGRARELEQLGRLVGGLAHEVRNPLQAISAGCEALRKEIQKDEGRFVLDMIVEQVDRVSLLMKDLLELGKSSRPESFREITLDTLLDDLEVEWAKNSLASAHPLLSLRPWPAATVHADRLRLLQALLNLLENAAQHAPEGERITCQVQGNGVKVTLMIEDRGPGIPPQYLPLAMEPFFTLRKGKTGLGLTYVRHVVEAHGGSVTLANSENGQGLTVTVVLPVSDGGQP